MCFYWWINVLISGVTSIFYVVLLLVLYIKLSRKIDNHSCRNQVSSSSSPSTKPEQPNTCQAANEALKRPRLRGDSGTSSDSSESSDSSPSIRQCPRSEEGVNYTSLVFQTTGRSASTAGDYENMKMGADYVNVDPQKRKVDFWTCSSPVSSNPVEYTEVKL
ncbi:regulator of hemoglobinization and erythroid cell expansion protein [Trachemys scripta elegans]|uniref:regulator of hemoglobinization and erythroid cell expansion protein n=1 Tax=Trachemys scripta elegans TaxID=31138 RepID=UPI00155245C4|nr:regulator of hemoglobinization and erythroid cell expansion protein [Trachemys scripta elegans]XP_034623043.1 regulator of hemoglobinization and erythroid cell expansion protein [Trachemys scripta elegans]